MTWSAFLHVGHLRSPSPSPRPGLDAELDIRGRPLLVDLVELAVADAAENCFTTDLVGSWVREAEAP